MALNQRQREVLANSTSTGAFPLGAHAGNVVVAFHEGRSFDTLDGNHTARASGANHANPAEPNGGHNTLSFSDKDGQRHGGNPARSNSAKGPSGRKVKTGQSRISGQ
jgi:hypothetical protein